MPKGALPMGSERAKVETQAGGTGLAAGELPSEVRPASEAEIELLVRKYIHAAQVLAECGWDGVNVHSAHGYLLSSLLSPGFNRRLAGV